MGDSNYRVWNVPVRARGPVDLVRELSQMNRLSNVEQAIHHYSSFRATAIDQSAWNTVYHLTKFAALVLGYKDPFDFLLPPLTRTFAKDDGIIKEGPKPPRLPAASYNKLKLAYTSLENAFSKRRTFIDKHIPEQLSHSRLLRYINFTRKAFYAIALHVTQQYPGASKECIVDTAFAIFGPITSFRLLEKKLSDGPTQWLLHDIPPPDKNCGTVLIDKLTSKVPVHPLDQEHNKEPEKQQEFATLSSASKSDKKRKPAPVEFPHSLQPKKKAPPALSDDNSHSQTSANLQTPSFNETAQTRKSAELLKEKSGTSLKESTANVNTTPNPVKGSILPAVTQFSQESWMHCITFTNQTFNYLSNSLTSSSRSEPTQQTTQTNPAPEHNQINRMGHTTLVTPDRSKPTTKHPTIASEDDACKDKFGSPTSSCRPNHNVSERDAYTDNLGSPFSSCRPNNSTTSDAETTGFSIDQETLTLQPTKLCVVEATEALEQSHNIHSPFEQNICVLSGPSKPTKPMGKLDDDEAKSLQQYDGVTSLEESSDVTSNMKKNNNTVLETQLWCELEPTEAPVEQINEVTSDTMQDSIAGTRALPKHPTEWFNLEPKETSHEPVDNGNSDTKQNTLPGKDTPTMYVAPEPKGYTQQLGKMCDFKAKGIPVNRSSDICPPLSDWDSESDSDNVPDSDSEWEEPKQQGKRAVKEDGGSKQHMSLSITDNLSNLSGTPTLEQTLRNTQQEEGPEHNPPFKIPHPKKNTKERNKKTQQETVAKKKLLHKSKQEAKALERFRLRQEKWEAHKEKDGEMSEPAHRCKTLLQFMAESDLEILDSKTLPQSFAMMFEQLREDEKGSKGLDWKADLHKLEATWILNMSGMGMYMFMESQKSYHSQVAPTEVYDIMQESLANGVAFHSLPPTGKQLKNDYLKTIHSDCPEWDEIMADLKLDLPSIVQTVLEKNGWFEPTEEGKTLHGDQNRGSLLWDGGFGNRCYDSDIPPSELDNLPNSPVMQKTGVTSDEEDKFLYEAVGDLADKCHIFMDDFCSENKKHYGDDKRTFRFGKKLRDKMRALLSKFEAFTIAVSVLGDLEDLLKGDFDGVMFKVLRHFDGQNCWRVTYDGSVVFYILFVDKGGRYGFPGRVYRVAIIWYSRSKCGRAMDLEPMMVSALSVLEDYEFSIEWEYSSVNSNIIFEKGFEEVFKLGRQDSVGMTLYKMKPAANCMAYHSLLIWTINRLKKEYNLPWHRVAELFYIALRSASSAAYCRILSQFLLQGPAKESMELDAQGTMKGPHFLCLFSEEAFRLDPVLGPLAHPWNRHQNSNVRDGRVVGSARSEADWLAGQMQQLDSVIDAANQGQKLPDVYKKLTMMDRIGDNCCMYFYNVGVHIGLLHTKQALQQSMNAQVGKHSAWHKWLVNNGCQAKDVTTTTRRLAKLREEPVFVTENLGCKAARGKKARQHPDVFHIHQVVYNRVWAENGKDVTLLSKTLDPQSEWEIQSELEFDSILV